MDGKFEKAKKEFQNALELDGAYQPARESLKVIEDVIRERIKDDSAVHFFKGLSYVNEKRFGDAVGSFSRSVAIDSMFPNAYYERGLAYSYTGDYDSAISDFTKSIELVPDDPTAYNNRGLAYAKGKQRYGEAIRDFSRAIELAPDLPDAYSNRGIAYAKHGDDAGRACPDWKRACELGKCDSYELAKQSGFCKD